MKINLRKNKIERVPIAMIGGGSWATALTKILTEQNVQIRWWMRNEEVIKHIKKYRRNPAYLSNVDLPKRKVKVFSDIRKALQDAELVIVAVPAAFVQNAMQSVLMEDLQDKFVISAVKGIIPERHHLVTDFLEQDFQLAIDNIGIIAGPCHAEEVAQEKKSYLTIASSSQENAATLAALLQCRYIQTTTGTDVVGIEYSAVMKNIVALACGIAHGLNYGDNFQAVLVSNAMQEIQHFVDAVNPSPRNILDSAYLGDLLVTAYSQFSRNRTFGNMIGRGYTVKSAQIEMNMVAEGYYAVKSIQAIREKYQVEMPISQTVYRILYEGQSPRVEMQGLELSLR